MNMTDDEWNEAWTKAVQADNEASDRAHELFDELDKQIEKFQKTGEFPPNSYLDNWFKAHKEMEDRHEDIQKLLRQKFKQ